MPPSKWGLPGWVTNIENLIQLLRELHINITEQHMGRKAFYEPSVGVAAAAGRPPSEPGPQLPHFRGALTRLSTRL